MVKRIILIASLLLVYAFASAQTLETVFNGYLLPITHAGKSGDTLTFRGKFVNSLGQYDGTEVDTTSVVVVEDSGNCYYLPVVDIDTKGTVITASVLDNTSSLATIPDGQAAIGDLTEYKGLFPQVAGVTSTLASCIQNYNNAILDREEIPDTISQAHNFPKGTAIWDSSGTWVKTFDYARDILVDAIVVDSISSTLFAVQYKGRFRMSNSYTVGKQLYVQPDGTYSTTDTSNHIAYGYALDDTYIQIGLQDNNSVTKDYVNERSYWYPQVTYLIDETVTYGGLIYANTAATNKGERPDTSSNWAVITTINPTSGSGNEFEIPFFDNTTTNLDTDTGLKYQDDTLKSPRIRVESLPNINGGSKDIATFLDSISGFRSYANLNQIVADSSSFRIGNTIEDRSSGARYKVYSDTVAGLPIDNVYQRDLGGGKYLIISNKHNFEFTNESIDSTVIKGITNNTDESVFKLSITNAASSDITFALPAEISNRKNITINVDDNSPKDIVIQGVVTDGNYIFDSYKASNGENIVLPYTDSKYRLITNKINSFYDSDKPLDYKDIPDNYELYNDGLVGYNSGAADSLFVLTRKKSWNVKSNLIPLSSFFTHVSTPTWVGSTSLDWTREKINTPAIESDYSFKLTLLEDNPNQLANSYTFATPSGDTIFGGREYNFSFYALIPNDQSKNVALTVRPSGSLDNSLKTIMELDTSSVGEWRRYNAIVRASATIDTFPTGRFWVSVSGDSSDYILIQDFQLTEGAYLQPYQKTHATPTINGGFNVVYKGIGDGRIYVDNVPNYYGLDDNEVVQRAFNFARHTPKSAFYLYSTNRFNTVYIQKDKLLTETIERPEGINLESNYGAGNDFNDLSNHAVIYSDLGDSTKSLFTYVDELSDNVVSGAITKNVALEALSRQRTFFLNEQLVDMLYQDVYIKADSLSEYGIENISSVNSNLYNTFRRVEVNEPREAGLMLRGTPNFVIDCKFFRGGHAIHAESMTWIHGLVAEQQDLPIIKFNSLTSLSIRDVYCEVNTTPYFQIDKATNIDIRGGLIGTVKPGSTVPYLIALDSVYTGSISGIFAHGGNGNRISTTEATGHITINNTIGNNPAYTWPGPQSHETWDGIADSTKIVSWGNTSLGTANDPSFWMPYLFYSTGFPDTSQLQEQLRLFKVRMDSLATITSGNVAGAASSIDNAIARYDGITGKIIQNSGVIIDDNDVIEIGNTTFSDLGGIITKGGVRFFHDFEYGNNGTVTPDGQNLFVGRGAGNYTMGATATATAHSSFNTGIGQSTFANLTTGYRGTALGASAGQSTTTGNNNTFIGYQAGLLNTTGGANVFLGSQAGYNNVSGASNVMIGNSAGRFRSDGVTTVTAASSSVFIGNNTRAGSSDGTNQTVIGTGAISLGSNTAQIGNTSVDSVGLGDYVFDVSGTPTHGQTFVYNASTDRFEPSNILDSLKWTHYTSITNGDTIVFNTDKNVIYLATGDSVYIDESGLTSDAILKVIQSSGIGTVFKVDGLSDRFYELGTNRSYSKTIGTGSVKELFYNKATNHWYTTSYYQSDIPIEDIATTTDTIVVYRGMEIAMDGTSGSYTVQLDLSELNEGESFNIKVDDIGASTVTIDVLNEASVVQYEGNSIAATHGFTGSYTYVHCSWRGGVLYITR